MNTKVFLLTSQEGLASVSSVSVVCSADMLGQALTAGSRGVAGVLVVIRGESGLELPVGRARS